MIFPPDHPSPHVDFDLLYESEEFLVSWTRGGRPFTGTATECVVGGPASAISYREGRQHGPAREWSPSRQLLEEAWWVDGERHGPSGTWVMNGVGLYDCAYFEYSIRVWRMKLDSSGRVVAVTPLNARDLERLERRRRGSPERVKAPRPLATGEVLSGALANDVSLNELLNRLSERQTHTPDTT